jgi:hypothetical protein
MDEGDRPLVFYYSRERRLARASERVREMNDGAIPRRRGLFRTLTSTKPLAFLFVSMTTLCIAIVLLSFLLDDGKQTMLFGNTLRVSAVSSGGKSYLTIKKTVKEDDSYTGPVDVGVSPEVSKGEEAPFYAERIYFTLENEEIFRFSVPFSASRLLLLMEAKEDRVFLKIKGE